MHTASRLFTALLPILLAVLALSPAAAAEPAATQPSRSLPVKSVTIFKDGHALIVHEGLAPVEDGKVVFDNLPTPVLGTFWAWSAQDGMRIKAVLSGREKTLTKQDIFSQMELLRANIGAEVLVVDQTGSDTYWATIEKVLSPPAPADTDPRRMEEYARGLRQDALVMFKTDHGIRLLRAGEIRSLTFRRPPSVETQTEVSKPALALHLSGLDASAKQARVGYMYVQKGLQWIPQYRLDLDGAGTCRARLQATLVNELVDLKETQVKLAVGSPPFAFADFTDPISLEPLLARIAPELSMMMSNRAQQVADMGEPRGGPAPPPEVPDLAQGERVEDLFVFDLGSVDLAKGQRAVLQVAAMQLPYQDVYKVGAASAVPPYLASKLEGQRPPEQTDAQEVTHDIRITNSGTAPLTTGPAMVLLDSRLIGQTQMTYVSPGSTQDLAIGKALDINVKVDEHELDRIRQATTWRNERLARLNMQGTLRLTNRMDKPAKIEAVRYVLGNPGEASHDGKIEAFPAFGNLPPMPKQVRQQAEAWWTRLNWPNWWWAVNSVCRYSWELTVEPGQTVELTYSWYYHWLDLPQ
jgi:hypothetical protein